MSERGIGIGARFGACAIAASCLLVLSSSAAIGQQARQQQPTAAPTQVEAKLAAMKITKGADGKESATPATNAKPGEVLEYRTTYTNNGKDRVTKVEATLPVPAGLEYLPGTASPAGALASLDGKTYQQIPLKRKVKQADGKIVEQEVPPGEYRSLRWNLGEMNAGQASLVSARMQLSPVITAAQQQAAIPAKK